MTIATGALVSRWDTGDNRLMPKRFFLLLGLALLPLVQPARAQTNPPPTFGLSPASLGQYSMSGCSQICLLFSSRFPFEFCCLFYRPGRSFLPVAWATRPSGTAHSPASVKAILRIGLLHKICGKFRVEDDRLTFRADPADGGD